MAKPRRIFTEAEIKAILQFYEIGQTDEQIARIFGLSRNAFNEAIKHNGITGTIKKGHKNTANAQVERSLFNQAMRGNTTASIFWLCNRDPERWQNLQQVKHSGTMAVTAKVIVEKLKGKDNASSN